MKDTNAPIRHHHIRAMLRSPAHYIATRQGQAQTDPTAEMEIGSGLHEMLAGQRDVITWEEGRPRRGKDYDAFVEANPGALILAHASHKLASEMHAAVLAHPIAGPLCRGGDAEMTLLWDVSDGEMRGRTTPDRLHVEDGKITIVEVKSARSSDPARFLWTARREYGYHTQAAWHATGVRATMPDMGGIVVRLVVVESSPPHVVTVIEVSAALLEVADAEIADALDRIAECRATEQWPGYVEDVWVWQPDEIDLQGSE